MKREFKRVKGSLDVGDIPIYDIPLSITSHATVYDTEDSAWDEFTGLYDQYGKPIIVRYTKNKMGYV